MAGGIRLKFIRTRRRESGDVCYGARDVMAKMWRIRVIPVRAAVAKKNIIIIIIRPSSERTRAFPRFIRIIRSVLSVL